MIKQYEGGVAFSDVAFVQSSVDYIQFKTFKDKDG